MTTYRSYVARTKETYESRAEHHKSTARTHWNGSITLRLMAGVLGIRSEKYLFGIAFKNETKVNPVTTNTACTPVMMG